MILNNLLLNLYNENKDDDYLKSLIKISYGIGNFYLNKIMSFNDNHLKNIFPSLGSSYHLSFLSNYSYSFINGVCSGFIYKSDKAKLNVLNELLNINDFEIKDYLNKNISILKNKGIIFSDYDFLNFSYLDDISNSKNSINPGNHYLNDIFNLIMNYREDSFLYETDLDSNYFLNINSYLEEHKFWSLLSNYYDFDDLLNYVLLNYPNITSFDFLKVLYSVSTNNEHKLIVFNCIKTLSENIFLKNYDIYFGNGIMFVNNIKSKEYINPINFSDLSLDSVLELKGIDNDEQYIYCLKYLTYDKDNFKSYRI